MARASRLQEWKRGETRDLIFSADDLTIAELADRTYTIYWGDVKPANDDVDALFSWVGTNASGPGESDPKTVTFTVPFANVDRTGDLYWEMWVELTSTGERCVVAEGKTKFKGSYIEAP